MGMAGNAGSLKSLTTVDDGFIVHDHKQHLRLANIGYRHVEHVSVEHNRVHNLAGFQ